MKTEEIEKKKGRETFISISNDENGFLIFLRFITFIILVAFENCIIRP